jgi:hypothetical protein
MVIMILRENKISNKYGIISWSRHDVCRIHEFYSDFLKEKGLAETAGWSNVQLDSEMYNDYGDETVTFYLVGDREENVEEIRERELAIKANEAQQRKQYEELKKKFENK